MFVMLSIVLYLLNIVLLKISTLNFILSYIIFIILIT